mmetsp:Transcript_19289/g.27903  ORF Transcript_19289/g.27903 Transcript_19289/m.27903 type:complete len:502 (+) Transcript_19289:188-1693(+)
MKESSIKTEDLQMDNMERNSHSQQQQNNANAVQSKPKSRYIFAFIFFPPLLLYLCPSNSTALLSPTLKVRYTAYFLLSLPFCFMAHLFTQTHLPLQQRLVAASFASSSALNQVGSFGTCAFVAATVVLWFGLSSIPLDHQHSSIASNKANAKKHDDDGADRTKSNTSLIQQQQLQTLLQDGKVRTILAGFFVTIALLTENFLVWVVSATYVPSHNDTPTPLQDNGRLVLQSLASLASFTKADLQSIRDALNVPWSLVSALATSLLCVELHMGDDRSKKRSLWGVVLRALMTLAFARMIRGISFSLTVLPSQIPFCYDNKFPNPPPDNWSEWIWVGLNPATNGGCNDLIVSGHATITSLFACICTSVSGNTLFGICVWVLLSVDFLVEMYQGLHYSVDMFLGGVITSLLWKSFAHLEKDAHIGKNTKFVSLEHISVSDGIWYGVPTYVAFGVLTFGSSFMANGFIYLYLVCSVGVVVKNGGYSHYVQHLLLCLLYVALGVYL